jgi:class 3 adenylate cyclase
VLRALLARYFERMRGIIEAHGGTVSLVDGAAAGITILVTIPLVPVRGARPKPFARKVDGLPERIQSIREEDIDSRHRLRPGEAG